MESKQYKKPDELWDKVRAALIKKKLQKDLSDPLKLDFFHKQEITENNKKFTLYFHPYDKTKLLLKIKNLKETLDKKTLLESCKNPVDFTGSISIFYRKFSIFLETWPCEEMLAFYCIKNIDKFEYFFLMILNIK